MADDYDWTRSIRNNTNHIVSTSKVLTNHIVSTSEVLQIHENRIKALESDVRDLNCDDTAVEEIRQLTSRLDEETSGISALLDRVIAVEKDLVRVSARDDSRITSLEQRVEREDPFVEAIAGTDYARTSPVDGGSWVLPETSAADAVAEALDSEPHKTGVGCKLWREHRPNSIGHLSRTWSFISPLMAGERHMEICLLSYCPWCGDPVE